MRRVRQVNSQRANVTGASDAAKRLPRKLSGLERDAPRRFGRFEPSSFIC